MRSLLVPLSLPLSSPPNLSSFSTTPMEDFEHSCEVYPADTNTPISADHFISSPSSDQFFRVEVECRSYFVLDGVVSDGFPDAIECGFSNIPKQDIEQFIHMLLPSVHVPQNSRARTAAKIMACAEHMANVTHKNHKVMGMRVVISNTTIVYQYYNPLRRVSDGPMVNYYEDGEDRNLRLIPASKSAIEGLERVDVTELDEGTSVGRFSDCTICLDDFLIYSEAIRMPCLHLFHSKCIINWLKNRNTCPLCRFALPTGDDDDDDDDDE